MNKTQVAKRMMVCYTNVVGIVDYAIGLMQCVESKVVSVISLKATVRP
jgi:hypothetical protein